GAEPAGLLESGDGRGGLRTKAAVHRARVESLPVEEGLYGRHLSSGGAGTKGVVGREGQLDVTSASRAAADQLHVVRPVPGPCWIGVIVARHLRVSDDVGAVLGDAVTVAQVGRQRRGGAVHRVGEPARVVDV